MTSPRLLTREAAAAEAAAAGPLDGAQEVEARLWVALRDVEDPEIPISVVGMGLSSRSPTGRTSARSTST